MNHGRGDRRVWLAGDAAHLTFPFGVQSMNEGIVEARELATRCRGVLEGVNPLASLESYGGERVARWRGLLAARDAAAANGTIRDPWLMANASSLIEAFPVAADEAADLLARIVST